MHASKSACCHPCQAGGGLAACIEIIIMVNLVDLNGEGKMQTDNRFVKRAILLLSALPLPVRSQRYQSVLQHHLSNAAGA
jgi:hypothetical protein